MTEENKNTKLHQSLHKDILPWLSFINKIDLISKSEFVIYQLRAFTDIYCSKSYITVYKHCIFRCAPGLLKAHVDYGISRGYETNLYICPGLGMIYCSIHATLLFKQTNMYDVYCAVFHTL